MSSRRDERLTEISPIVIASVKRTSTIGDKHVINLSLSLETFSKTWACFRNTSTIASGVLKASSATENGCVDRSCPVMVLYSFVAASNILTKLALEELVVGLVADMGIATRREDKCVALYVDSDHKLRQTGTASKTKTKGCCRGVTAFSASCD